MVFESLPPERDQLPTRKEWLKATIRIQGFVFNAFGSIAILPWVFAIEKAIKNRKGDPLHPSSIGLAAPNMAIRKKDLSQNFQNYLKGKDEWFQQVVDFRRSLALRLRPVVPPCITDKEAAYNEIQVAVDDAIARQDFDTYDAKSEQRCALRSVRVC